jgi:alpha-glucosidase
VLSCTATAGGFTVTFKGRSILTHSRRRPCIHLGVGRGRYRMVHGNFRLRERLDYRRPCLGFRCLPEPDGACGPERNRDGLRGLVIEFPSALTLRFQVREERLHLSFAAASPAINRFWMRLPAERGEHIYGCGEQYSALDLKGRKVPLWVQEQGVGRGRNLVTLASQIESRSGGCWHTTYFPQPTFVSSNNWFCHVAASAYAELDFRRPEATTLYLWQVPEEMVFDCRPGAPGLLESLSGLLGRQPALPEWVYDGMWLGVQGGTGPVQRKLDRALEAGVKVSALWVQDWEGRRVTSFGRQLMWNWEYEPAAYPGLPQQIRRWGEGNLGFLGYINPFLALEGSLYREASRRGFCVKNPAGEDYRVTVTTFPAALLDLTHPQAVEWIKGVIRTNLIGIGMRGWMADYGEYLPVDAVLHSGRSAELLHNLYPVLWARVNREAVRESGGEGRIVFFMRSGYTGASRQATAFWAGDQLADWSRDDGLASVIPAAISLGFCGIGIHHSDIGGYTSLYWIRRGKELFQRWAEMCAFTPIMRTHEGNRPGTNWQFDSDEDTLRHLARMTRIYAALKAYHLHTMGEYVEKGLPPLRHPYIHYEGDGTLHRLKYQYLYGRDLLVAPVLRRGRRRWRVYLPDDRWIHLWSGREEKKGWRTVAAPLGDPPVFYRARSRFAPLFAALPEAGGTAWRASL